MTSAMPETLTAVANGARLCDAVDFVTEASGCSQSVWLKKPVDSPGVCPIFYMKGTVSNLSALADDGYTCFRRRKRRRKCRVGRQPWTQLPALPAVHLRTAQLGQGAPSKPRRPQPWKERTPAPRTALKGLWACPLARSREDACLSRASRSLMLLIIEAHSSFWKSTKFPHFKGRISRSPLGWESWW